MNAIEKLIDYAKSQIGTTEYDGGKNPYSKYIDETFPPKQWYNGRKNGFDWCTCFVDACFLRVFGYDNARKMVNQISKENGLLRAGVKYMYYAYKQMDAIIDKPVPGCVIFFGKLPSLRHVGIVTKVTTTYVYTVEGNANNAVREGKYKLSNPDIFGYALPDYTIVEDRPTPTTHFETNTYYKIITKEFLNIRPRATIKCNPVGRLEPKTVIKCTGEVAENPYIWVKIADGLYICGNECGIDYITKE